MCGLTVFSEPLCELAVQHLNAVILVSFDILLVNYWEAYMDSFVATYPEGQNCGQVSILETFFNGYINSYTTYHNNKFIIIKSRQVLLF